MMKILLNHLLYLAIVAMRLNDPEASLTYDRGGDIVNMRCLTLCKTIQNKTIALLYTQSDILITNMLKKHYLGSHLRDFAFDFH